MSVLVIVKIPGNVDVFAKSLEERGDEFARIAERAKPLGGRHHQFGLGPDYVLVVDEWETVEQFESFFSDPELQAFIGSVGGDPGGAPEITVATAVDSVDKF
jgi:hypothetical protein